MSFDTQCFYLAEHFLPNDAPPSAKNSLAQHIQDAVEAWECDEDDHRWKYIRDWWGDPGVIGGTQDLYSKHCELCGKDDDWDGSVDDESDYMDAEARERS